MSPHVGSGLITSRNGAINARDNSLVNMSTHHNTRDDSQTNESQGRYIAQVKLASQQENSTGKHTARNFRRMKKSSLPRINSNERGNSGSKDEPPLREASDYTAMTTQLSLNQTRKLHPTVANMTTALRSSQQNLARCGSLPGSRMQANKTVKLLKTGGTDEKSGNASNSVTARPQAAPNTQKLKST